MAPPEPALLAEDRTDTRKAGDLLPRATVPAMLRSFAERYGSLPQVIDGATSLSFSQVEAATAQLARGFIAQGVGKGSHVGLLMPNCIDWVLVWYALTRIGAFAVLMSTFARPREIRHMLAHGDIEFLVSCDRFLNNDYVAQLEEAIPDLGGRRSGSLLLSPAAPSLRKLWIFGEAPPWADGGREELLRSSEAVSPEFLEALEAQVYPSDWAIMIYTSGSTADPKAVVHNHDTVVGQSAKMADYSTCGAGDRSLILSPFFWVGGLCTSMLAANHRGAAAVVPSSPAPEDAVRAIREGGATHVSITPAKARALLDVPGYSREEFLQLKPAYCHQAPVFDLSPANLTPDSLGMSETFGPHSMELPGCRLTEAQSGSFGRAVPEMERRIVDPDTGRELEPGQFGELEVRGRSLMVGYYKVDRSQAFDRDGWFATGDLCALDADGHLFFQGRLTEMIKTSGANVAPLEVEAVLREHADVADVAVVGIPDAHAGQRVIAAVVPQVGGHIEEEDLKAWLKAQIASYKVPKRILSFQSSEMPRTPTGKIRKDELQSLLASRPL